MSNVRKPLVRRLLFLAWLLVPIACIAWHYGPGQAELARDLAGEHVVAGRYVEAISSLPENDDDTRNRLLLKQAKARIQKGEMIEGQEQLQKLLADLESRDQSSTPLAAGVRHELATASYHTAWLMRLEGATPQEWKPESERARQQFRLLAELHGDDDPDRRFQKNLEATIRLEQMDLDVLKAKPLPKNCPNCCKNLSQRKRKQCQSRGKGKKKEDEKGKKKKRQDARQQIKQQRGAGLNEGGGKGS